MNTIPSPGKSGIETGKRLRPASLALTLFPLLMSVQVAAQESIAAQEPIAAVWKAREVNFLYRSSVAIYDCSALRERVSSILRAVGARDDINVSVSNCDDSPMATQSFPNSSADWGIQRQGRPSAFPSRRDTREPQLVHIRVRLMMPTEVTPDVLGELEKDKSRRELISRVTGNPAARYNDAIVFAAQRQSVTLSHRSIGIEPAECELLEQMSTGVFRELDVRVVRGSRSCDPRGVSHIPVQLTAEALMWTAVQGGGGAKMPAEGDGKDESSVPAASEPPAEPAAKPPE